MLCSILFASKCWRHSSEVHKRSGGSVLHRCRGRSELSSQSLWLIFDAFTVLESALHKFIRVYKINLLVIMQCFIVSTVNALKTPMINASMVTCLSRFGCFFFFLLWISYTAYGRFCVTDTMGELTILLVGLVGSQNH